MLDMTSMITIDDKAKEKLIELRTEQGYDASYFLRVSVVGGGCSGLSYKLDFDNQLKAGDQMYNEEDFPVVVDMKSLLYVAGTELVFTDGLNGKGFEFHNPNATRTCGCGESFAV
jgi:iron-sulfur cluster assembly protein